jgi:PTH1 family peptidyl-tRNA hydrolase
MPGERMKIVVGLGNPGRQYAGTRHNVGWMVLDRLVERAGWPERGRKRDLSATVQGRHKGLDLLLVKPQTFMNLSGEAVRKVLARQRAPLTDVLVVVDDFALPLGRLRIRAQGSAGGHNGLQSIIDELGTQSFARLRVGIGAPAHDAIDHVLSRFEAGEKRLLDVVLDAAVDAVEDWARAGTATAADRWNGWRAPHEPTGSSADAAPLSDAAPPADTQPVPDAGGIVRTRTGWRRLLDRGR